ncbi:MAG: YbaK/EbsC family protein [Planctomycetes bacterium]|nr:YbaK/EbsC family protein [Planctomycetota bacterium]
MTLYEFMNKHRLAYKTYAHDEVHDSQHLAEALRVPGRNVAKTVLLCADHGYACVLVVVPATAQVDLRLVSKCLGGAEIRLATQTEIATHCPGCDHGVLPPFGTHLGIRTIVDSSLAEHEDLFFQGCSQREAIRLSYHDYCEVEHPLVAQITRQEVATSCR